MSSDATSLKPHSMQQDPGAEMSTHARELGPEISDCATTLEQLKALKAEHLLARQKLNMAHDRFIQDMPLNIIIQVFLIDKKNHSSITDTARPLILASVSRSWRSVIFSVPQIWATMRMHRSRSYWSFPQGLVEAWLARSGALPLRIGLSWVTPLSHDRTLPLQRIGGLLQLIQKQSHRLESLQLDVPTAVLTTLTPEDTPLLRSFHLAVGEVDLDRTNINYGLLTEIHIKGGLNTLETLELFRRCPNLAKCILCVQNLYFEPSPEQLPSTPIVLPHLLHLKLELLMEIPETLVDRISLPRLRYFHLVMLQTRFHAPTYAAMIERSGCAVRSFTYENDYMDTDEDISILLKVMPTVQHLCLKVDNRFSEGPHDLDGPLFGRLVRPTAPSDQESESESAFLPALRKLLYWGPLPFSWDQYASFCEAYFQQRMTSPSLAVVRIHITKFECAIDEDALRRLNALPQKTQDIIRLTPRELWGLTPSNPVDES